MNRVMGLVSVRYVLIIAAAALLLLSASKPAKASSPFCNWFNWCIFGTCDLDTGTCYCNGIYDPGDCNYVPAAQLRALPPAAISPQDRVAG